MTLFNNFCAAILAVASSCGTAINDAARIIFGVFAAGTNTAVGFLPTIRRMKLATAFLAVAVAIPLMSACGGGGGGGTDLNSPRSPGTAEGVSSVGSISETTVTAVVALVSAEETTPIPPTMATISADFTTAAGTGEDLVFPVSDGSALIRSEDGNDYALIYQQDEFTPSTSTIELEPVHVWEFETGQTNSEVVSVVAAFQAQANTDADLAPADVTVTVKGARDRVNVLRESDGENIRYSVDAYIFETEYSALGLWIEDPREFFGLSTVARDPDVSESEVFYFGLRTPTTFVPSGMATYSGVAAGQYLRNLGTVTADRFFVSGVVTLTADFNTDAGISGTADLEAYNVADLATSSGTVNVLLNNTSGSSESNIDDATFDGTATIMGTPTGAFADLASGVVADDSGFEGYFTGPEAEEAVGGVRVVTNGADGDADTLADNDFLEFGFLTREQP